MTTRSHIYLNDNPLMKPIAASHKLLLIAILFLFAGCENSEENARVLQNKALSLEQTDPKQAITLYKEIVEKYPTTATSIEANKRAIDLSRIETIVNATPESGFISKAKSDIRALSSSVKLYKLDNSEYPNKLSDLVSGGASGRGYLDAIPKDPWGEEYQYRNPGERSGFDIWAKSKPEISNWNL